MKRGAGTRAVFGIALHSTDKTVNDGQVTLLAVLEAFLASLALVLYLTYGGWFSFPYIYAGSILVLGPLSLQRTDRSEEIGLIYYDRLERTTFKVNAFQEAPVQHAALREIRLFLGFMFFLMIVPVWMWVIRPVSVFKAWFSGHFWESVFAIPKNWYRTVFVLDFVYLPEAVPGIEKHRTAAVYRCRSHFWNSFETLKQEQAARSTIFKFAYVSVWMVQWAILFLPGAMLRLGVKSTIIIWAPITGIIWRRSLRDKDLDETIDYILHDYLEKFSRWIVAPSHLVGSLILPVGLFAYHLYSIDFLSPDASGWVAVVLSFIKWSFGFNVVTGKFETVQIWGWCSAVGAIITFVLFHIAKTEERREKRQFLPLKKSGVRISALMLVRNLISLFVIFKPLSDLVAVLMVRGRG